MKWTKSAEGKGCLHGHTHRGREGKVHRNKIFAFGRGGGKRKGSPACAEAAPRSTGARESGRGRGEDVSIQYAYQNDDRTYSSKVQAMATEKASKRASLRDLCQKNRWHRFCPVGPVLVFEATAESFCVALSHGGCLRHHIRFP